MTKERICKIKGGTAKPCLKYRYNKKACKDCDGFRGYEW